MHLLSQGPVHPPQATASTLVADGLLPDPASLVANMGELLLARSLKVAAVVLGAVVTARQNCDGSQPSAGLDRLL
jgi:hypothetical protein